MADAKDTDLSCLFDKTSNTATIVDGGSKAVMFGQNMQDINNSFINRALGSQPNKDFEGTAVAPSGEKVGAFNVSTAGKDRIACEGGGVKAFGMKPTR